MIFLVLSGKMIFLFAENMILFFGRKMKDDLSQKNTWKCDIFFKCTEKIISPKKNHAGIWSFLYYVERWYFFFFWKYDSFSSDGKWKMIFLKKYMEVWYFLYICINVTNMTLLFCKKTKQRWSSPEKIHLKVTDILDCILERGPMILCTFMETFIGVCIYCFPVKNPGNLICRTEIWLCLQFIWLEIFCNE